MLGRILQVASSKAPTYRLRHHQLRPAASIWRSFSDVGGGKGGDDDDESRMQDIYLNLFGAGDSAGESAGGADSFDGGKESMNSESGGRSDFGRFGTAQGADANEGAEDSLEEVELPNRLWADSLDISDEDLHNKTVFDDIPDWSPDFVSRISKERVQILEDGIPTLSTLSSLPLPPPPFPHPGHGASKEYAALRRRAHQEYINQEVAKVAEPKLTKILALPSWLEKQEAVDELFESVEFELRDAEPILQGHPKFGEWVEGALESYLKVVARNEHPQSSLVGGEGSENSADDGGDASDNNDSATAEEAPVAYPSVEEDEKALPVYVDYYSEDDPEDQMVPSILTPLKPHHNGGPGRMVEEWELSAHDTTKRIMLRQSTREIARALQESESARVFVTGRRGVGKTAAIATIVASARQSGQIVLYMPDGNRLHRLGYYVEPNPKLEGMFDIPMLSQEVCNELLSVHEADLDGMEVDQDVMEHHFTDVQLEAMAEYSGGKTSVIDLLKAAQSDVANAAGCFTVVVDHLIKQEEKHFLMVMDEFNCYFEPGHYFHMDYDEEVNEAIPYDQINLFKPLLDAIALSLEEDEDIPLKAPVVPKHGGIVVGISESCAIARKVTDSLSAYASRSALGEKSVPLSIIDVPRFSELEVDHVIANFECIGIGNLRCDRGETVMNKEGINYLKMVSSKVGQKLIDVCCH